MLNAHNGALGTSLPGKINEAEELQYFLNELERNLRALDPQAEISLTDRKGR